MKLSDYLVEVLASQNIKYVFGYAGGPIMHIIDSLHNRDDIDFISVHHEQAAAFAAEGYARVTNNLGVAIATSGPGATNLMTGIGSSYFDSIPCLYITGQVNTYEYKGDLKVRQLGFQETDIVSIVKPITKYAVRVTDAKDIKYEIFKAISIAQSGRPGSVLVDIPMNILRAEIVPSELAGYVNNTRENITNFDMDEIVSMIKESQRPVILVGGGVRLANAQAELKIFLDKTKIPVVASLMGLDSCDNNYENYCGLIGAYGNRYGNFTLANSDLVISLGSRLDSRQTGTRKDTFVRKAKLIRVDIDEDELSRKVKTDEISIAMSALSFLKNLNNAIEDFDTNRIKKLAFESR